MAEDFLSLDAREQGDILRTVAARSGRAAVVLEKDVWICWVLRTLFSIPDRHPMAFKGGDHDHFVDPVAGRRLTGLGRAVLRLDGFVAAEAGFEGGELITQPLTFDGDRLLLNLQASGGGSLQVEVLDADGRALDGYASGALIGDSVALEWRPQQGLRRIAGRPIRLRLRLRACSLYAFHFAD